VLRSLPLGLAALEVEAVTGTDTRPARAGLRRVVAEARRRVPDSREPRATLAALAEAAAVVCPTFEEGQAGTSYGDALRAGACDCDVLVLTYLTAADALDLPVTAVFLPGHVLLVWDDGRERVYWETTVPVERPAWFVDALVPEGAERAYLRPQSRTEMVGYLYLLRADARHAHGDLAGADADYDRALRMSPALVIAFHNRGRAHLLGGEPAAAFADFDRALALDPTYADARYGRGLALLLQDRPADALADFDRSLASEETAADVLHARGLALDVLGRSDEALHSFGAALDADPTFLVALLDRAALYERRGEADRARDDYLAFVEAASGTAYEATIPDAQRRLLRLRRSRS
jgi:Tfp pilus assembly protein PilF